MAATRPAPYPADTLARGWRFEVDMEAVKRSDTWKKAKTGALRGALLLLWAEAWQEKPCGTLPDDDELIALMVDMAPALFVKHKGVLLRGWWKAEDGRLYHDTITTRVLAMLAKRANDAERAAARRARAAASGGGHAEVTRDAEATPGEPPREFYTKHQAPSTSQQDKPVGKARKRAESVAPGILVAAGFDADAAAEFIAHKDRVKAPLTLRAWVDHVAESEKAGWTPQQAAEKVMAKGWKGFEAKYVASEQRPAGTVIPINRQEAIEVRNSAVGDEWLRQQEAADATR